MSTTGRYLTAPQPLSTMPPGIPYIVGNEAAERFSFYGMRAILTTYMTAYLVNAAGVSDVMGEEEAKAYVHLFVASAYFFPILGAVLSDWLLGKYRTILILSIVYCLGHLALAAVPGRTGLLMGLALVAVGAGGIKPCVSAHVGDQFGEQNRHLLERVFSWFYFSINLGAFVSTLLTPWLLDHKDYGPHWAFGIPGVLMALATLCFWLGRNKFVHVPPGGLQFFRDSFGADGLSAIVRLIPLYLFVAVFWSLYDQTMSAWVLQAGDMDRVVWLPKVSSSWPFISVQRQELIAAQLQAVNPLLILLYIPLFAGVIFPLGRRVGLTALGKVSIGFFLTAGAFAISGYAQWLIDQGQKPHIQWQIWAYVVMTAAEVLVSITCLEFSYRQAPNRMKSFIMSLYLLSVTAGNLLASGVNFLIVDSDGKNLLPGALYYWFFTGLMFVAAVLFIPVALTFRERTYLQQEASTEA